MADGMAGVTADSVYEFPGQKMIPIARECGACDPEKYELRDAPVVRKYATGFLKFTNAAGVLTLAKDTKVTLFTAGVDEAGTDAAVQGNLTYAETDCFKEGALCPEGWIFLIQSMEIQFEDPFLDGTTHQREVPDWLVTEAGYRESGIRGLRRDLTVTLTRGEGMNAYELGPVGMYPSDVAPGSDGRFPQSGGIPNAKVPFESVIKSGGAKSSNKVSVVLQARREIILSARTEAATDDVMFPVRVLFTGYSRRRASAEKEE